MKKRILGILTVVLALSMAFTMVSCGDKGGDDDPEVTGVTVTPSNPTVNKGAKEQFTANVTVKGGAAKTVNWTLDGYTGSDSTLSNTGELSVGANETATTLKVRATSTVNTAKFGETTVTVGSGAVGITYTVIFEDADGTELKKVENIAANGVVLAADFPANPTPSGTDLFSGWINKDTQTSFTPATLVTGNITVVPNFVPAGTTYTVIFKVGDTETKKVENIVPLGKVAAADFPTDPTAAEGQEFVEWRIEGTTAAFTADIEIVADTTVVAYFRSTSGINYVTISFNVNYPAGLVYSGPAIESVQVEEEMEIGDLLPAGPAAPEGYVFGGWFNPQGAKVTEETTFLVNTTLSAEWIVDVLTGDDAFEALYLQNGGTVIYKFDIPAGKKLGDYSKIVADYKISGAGLAIWDTSGVGLQHVRLLGVYNGNETVSTAGNADLGLPDIKYLDRNNLSTPYIISNSNTATSLRDSVTANEWFTVTYQLDGSEKHAEAVNANLPPAHANDTGVVYFALGLTCQNTNNGAERNKAFLQLIKDIKMVSEDGEDEVVADKPTGFADFNCYQTGGIVWEWRGEPTESNIANWETLIPAIPEDTFYRGDPPDADDLVEVQLGAPGITYINKGNPNNQRGWVSFGEAGNANDQSYTGDASTIAFENFINAWYLVLETGTAPTGTLSFIWMGDAGVWMDGGSITTNAGAAIEGTSTITGSDAEGWVITALLPKALAQYGKYFNDNTEWAGFSLGYWGANSTNLNNLNVKKAALLLKDDEVAPPPTGISLGLSFTYGPEGGALIDDVVLDGDNLVVTAVSDLTEFRWYVDGVKNEETEGTLTIPAVSGTTVTLYAQRGSRWASQAVKITVSE